jgi:hypothetical protein
MENISMKREGSRLLIEIDLARTIGPSSSGKTTIVATSHGNARIPGAEETFIGINCFRYPAGRKAAAPSAS